MENKLIILTFLLCFSRVAFGQVLFHDDFEGSLGQWEYRESGIAQIFVTEDSIHKSVLKLIPNKTAECILICNSDVWKGIEIIGQVLFPTDRHNYLGLVYNYHEDERIDFGCIYIKGNGSYIRVNPHRDGNASRALYEEYKTDLVGNQKININEWIYFKAEIIGSECHFYVMDMEKPKIIFKHFEYSSGKIGFKPRLAGGECWIDDISVNNIEGFSYTKSIEPNSEIYHRDMMLNEWKALGPINKRINEIEKSNQNNPVSIDGEKIDWSDFSTDYRGCLLAGKICRYSTDQKYAYFTTNIDAENEIQGELQFSSLNNLHVWVNSKYLGFIEEQKYAWFDFHQNLEHAGKTLSVKLQKGINRILILVEGANYSGDGFYTHFKK